MKFLLIIFFTASLLSAHSQTATWMGPVKVKGYFVLNTLPGAEGNFYAYDLRGANWSSIGINRYDGYKNTKLTEIETTKEFYQIGYSINYFNGKICRVYMTGKGDNKELWFQTYTDQLELDGNPVSIGKISNNAYENVVMVTLSDNKEFIAIDYWESMSGDSKIMRCTVFNRNLQLVNSKVFSTHSSTELSARLLSNNGTCFFAEKQFAPDNQGQINKKNNAEKLVIHWITSTNTGEITLPQDKQWAEIQLTEESNTTIAIDLLYGSSPKKSQGCKYYSLDYINDSLSEKFSFEFDRNLILEGLISSDLKKVAKQESNNIVPELINYSFKQRLTLSNQNSIIILEQGNSFIESTDLGGVKTTGANFTTGSTGTTGFQEMNIPDVKMFSTNDLLIYCLSPKGTLLWIKKIEKRQEAVDPRVCSYIHVLKDNNLSLFLNDNSINYDSNGEYIVKEKKEKIVSNLTSTKGICVSRITLNTETGEFKRTIVVKPSQKKSQGTGLISVSKVDYSNNKLIIPHRHKQHSLNFCFLDL